MTTNEVTSDVTEEQSLALLDAGLINPATRTDSTVSSHESDSRDDDRSEGDSNDEPLKDAGLNALKQERENVKQLKAQLNEATEQLASLNTELAATKTGQEQLANAQGELARYKLAFSRGLSADDLDALPTGLDEEALTKIADRLAASARRPAPNPTQGTQGQPRTSPAQAFQAFLDNQMS